MPVKHLHGPVIARIAVWYCTRDPRALEALSTEFLLQSANGALPDTRESVAGAAGATVRGAKNGSRVFVFVSELWVDICPAWLT